jgi:spore maturation protein CgeB
LLVSDLPDWISTFVHPGYARACNPEDADSIERELRWYLEHPAERNAMGRMCKDKIRREWNYETEFDPVLVEMEALQCGTARR